MSNKPDFSKRTIWLQFNMKDFNNALEWYRASHHGFRCSRQTHGCHMTKNKILEALKEMVGPK